MIRRFPIRILRSRIRRRLWKRMDCRFDLARSEIGKAREKTGIMGKISDIGRLWRGPASLSTADFLP